MRRLLQFGTFLFVAAAILAPVAECLDSWDPPGLSTDTEFALFTILLTLCLVLLVASLIAALALLIRLIPQARAERPAPSMRSKSRSLPIFLLPPLPLRI